MLRHRSHHVEQLFEEVVVEPRVVVDGCGGRGAGFAGLFEGVAHLADSYQQQLQFVVSESERFRHNSCATTVHSAPAASARREIQRETRPSTPPSYISSTVQAPLHRGSTTI